jgi:hypothetical protein
MSTRTKRRTKRKVKQSQKMAWMVELRLLGWPTEGLKRGFENAGNYTHARRYYQSLLARKPNPFF